MKNTSKHTEPTAASLREIPEIDFGRLVRGRRGGYAHLLTGEQTHMVVIDKDLWSRLGSARKVNDALRRFLKLQTRAPGD